MAGRRALTRAEERQLLCVVRKLKPRDRALVTTQWFTGFRIHEVLSLRVGDVVRNGELVTSVGIAPRHLKGHYGRTRWVPVLAELRRALLEHLRWLRRCYEVKSALPLFPSRQRKADGSVRFLARSQAHDVLKAVFRAAEIQDDGRLGTHTLRKTFARNVYLNGGRDIMLLKRALGHANVAATERYLEIDEQAVIEAIAKCDFTRAPRKSRRCESRGTAVPK
jgi:integrase